MPAVNDIKRRRSTDSSAERSSRQSTCVGRSSKGQYSPADGRGGDTDGKVPNTALAWGGYVTNKKEIQSTRGRTTQVIN